MRVPSSSALVCVIAVVTCACSSGDAKSANSTPSDEITFSTSDYTVAPGEEKYVCWTETLPADQPIAVREVHADYGAATHHVFFAWTLAPEPDGMSECPVLFKTTWIPMYLGGVNSSPLRMPDGAAIDLGSGRQILIQLHMQNTTPNPIVNRVTMHMKLQPAGSDFIPAGIYGLDNRVISLPANTDNVTTTMSCSAPKQMNVFSTLGHMHKLGKELQLSKNGAVAFTENWNFDDQPITPLDMMIAPGDQLSLACTHSNPLDHAVTYGESSDTEMCAMVFYYTPFDHLDGCVNAPAAGTDDGGVPTGDGGA